MARFATATLLLALTLAPTAPLAAQAFGGSLALGEDQLFVGEARNQTLSGILYVFSDQQGTWQLTQELRINEELRAPDGFGRAFDHDEVLLVVGAPSFSEGAGTAVVFERDASGNWSERARLPAGAATPGTRMGSAVSIDAGVVWIGAPGASDGAGEVWGFTRNDSGAWTRLATLSTSQADLQGFGTHVVVSGDDLLVTSATERGGAADVFTFARGANGQWAATGRLQMDGLPQRSGYGSAVALADGVALIGAPGMDQNTGRVFVFERTGDGWTPAAPLGPLNAHPNARFGSSVDFDGVRASVGAPGTLGVGQAYLALRGSNGAWSEASSLVAPSAEAGWGVGGAVATRGSLAVTGALGVDEGQGAVVVLEADEGAWSESATLLNDPRGFDAITGEEIYCTEGQASLFECKDVNITAFLPISELGGTRGTRVNDVWGWTDPETNVEYVIVGRTNGTSFVDISDPYDPVYIGDLPKTEGTRTTIWRDVKVYANHAYIVADAAGEHGVQVFDLTQLRDFQGTPMTFEETFLYDGIHSAHNIVINEDTGFGYAVGNSGGGETCGGGLHMIDLRTPAEPKFAGCFSERETGRRGTGYSHDAQCVVYHGPDEEHQGKEVCFGSNETALNIADVTDKSAPTSIATASYPSVAYAHQGWLTEDHAFFYMNDEGDEPQGLVEGTRTLVWDVTDLDDPILVKEHIAETTATDHNLYVRGDRMYQSNYAAGFRVLDISNPADPVEIGFFDTSPYEGGASWSNYPFFQSGIIAVTGTGDGLFLVKDMARRNLIP